jgi:hypothetical protein
MDLSPRGLWPSDGIVAADRRHCQEIEAEEIYVYPSPLLAVAKGTGFAEDGFGQVNPARFGFPGFHSKFVRPEYLSFPSLPI